MSALNIFGGIGQGLMQGSQFVAHQRERENAQSYRDQVLANQQQQLAMQQETHGLRVDAARRELDEQKRVEQLATMRNRLAQDYPDASPHQREQMFVDRGVSENLFRGEELAQAQKTRDALRRQFGVEAYDAALAGDLKPLQSLLGEKGMAVDFTPDRRQISIWTADSPRDTKGNITQPLKTIPFDGLLQLDAMGAAAERQIARQKAGLEARKTRAEIGEKEASAVLKLATAEGKNPTTLDANGNQVPNPNYRGAGKGGRGQDDGPIASLKDYTEAVQKAVGEGVEFDFVKGFKNYAAMMNGGVDAQGRPLAPGDAATVLEDSIALTRGEGVTSPNVGRTGGLALTADVAGRTYGLSPEFTEREALAMRDKDGKPLYTPETLNDLYLQALQTHAVSNPAQFEQAWQIVNDPQARDQVVRLAQAGDARAVAALKTADVLARGAERARQTAPAELERSLFSSAFNADDAPKEFVGEQQKRLGDALGLQAPPAHDELRAVGDAAMRGAYWLQSGILQGADSVGRMLVGAHPHQREQRVRDELRLYRAAKHDATRRHYATRLFELAKGDEALTRMVIDAVGR